MKTIPILSDPVGRQPAGGILQKDDDTPAPTIYYQQQDQMGCPAINTIVFNVSAADKDAFNVATASQNAASRPSSRCKAWPQSGVYNQCIRLERHCFTSVLATDILNVSTSRSHKIFSSTN